MHPILRPSHSRRKKKTKNTPRFSLVILRSERATAAYARRFARRVKPGDLVLLLGKLGSGKTTFVRGLARGLSIRKPVVSPTFLLRKRYPVTPRFRPLRALNHLDAYRLGSADEVQGLLDGDPYRSDQELWCVEWGERVCDALPKQRTWRLVFAIAGKTKRHLRVFPPRPVAKS